MTNEEIQKLKDAGIDDATIQSIAAEDAAKGGNVTPGAPVEPVLPEVDVTKPSDTLKNAQAAGVPTTNEGSLMTDAAALGAAAAPYALPVAGAGLGAGVSALTGGDVGEGALMGGIGGLASGAVGALGPAFQGGEVASKVGEQAIQQGTQQVAQEGVNQAAQQAVQQGAQQVAQEGVNQTAQQVAQKSAEQLAQEGVSQTAQAVMHEAYYSEAWIKNFKQHVVPILIKYGVA